jgi:lactate permease
MENADLLKALLALLPIAVIFVAMLALKLSSWKAGAAAAAAACIMAFFVWKMDILHIGEAVAEGALGGILPIAWVIFTAMLLYNLYVKSGAMESIQGMLTRFAPDEASKVLLIAFGFGSFLESVSGFGTPVVVPMAILILLGFEPLRAAVICLVANTLAVAFGVVGIPVITLAGVSSLPVRQVSLDVSLQLFPFSLLLPFLLVFLTVRSLKKMKPYLALCLLAGAAFAVMQTLSAWLLGPELPAVIGSLSAMAVVVLWERRKTAGKGEKTSLGLFMKSWSAYILILALVIATRLIPALSFLDQAPFKAEWQIYTAPGAKPFTASLLTNPGTIIFLSGIAFAFLYRIPAGTFFSVMGRTFKQVKNAVLTVVLIVALAKVLSYSGMTQDLALGLAAVSGGLYPLLSPVIGCIGTFVTGSDTSSNILFGLLQKQTAQYIGVDAAWLTAANAAGATIGKMISPVSIALAGTAAKIPGGESGILKTTVRYAAVLIAVMAAFIYATSLFVKG